MNYKNSISKKEYYAITYSKKGYSQIIIRKYY
jgi:hypothetical protein